jgi:uracil-DNA glycosylase
MSATREIRKLIEDLAAVRLGPAVANPWSEADEDPALDAPGAAALRRANLQAYLTLVAARRPRLLIVGEAPSYRGCRFTGIIFTSEHTLLTNLFFAQAQFVRTSFRPQPWREQSATIVWGAIDQLERPPVLWAAVPYHTHRPGEPLSNRTPTRDEAERCLPLLKQVRALFPDTIVLATGRVAERSLAALAIPCTYVRHPAHGGKTAFQAGVLAADRRAKG